jgi:hypothetical protein
MSNSKIRSALVGALVAFAAAVCAPGAMAAITPSVSLDQSAGTQAAASQNLGMDLKFNTSNAYPVADTPDDLTINLPPGLLANASVDGGACLTTTDLSDTNCQVGTGSVTAYAAGLVPLTVDVTFDLVPPPAPGDLAGLAVNRTAPRSARRAISGSGRQGIRTASGSRSLSRSRTPSPELRSTSLTSTAHSTGCVIRRLAPPRPQT